MIPLGQIQEAYDPHLQNRGEDLLREYLQYEILKLIFEGKYAHKYTFLGGTCIRLCYHSQRFSEDLDFDNEGLTQEEFEATAADVKLGLERLGFDVEISFTYKGAFHCKVRFPALLHLYQLSPHKEARLLIKLDTEKQHFNYQRTLIPIDKFGVRTDVLATPLHLLASQKIAAIMGRKQFKGRDFYDLRFILKSTTPDYGYLNERFEISRPEELRRMIRERIDGLDFKMMAADVQDFLFETEDLEMVMTFPEYWEQVNLGSSLAK